MRRALTFAAAWLAAATVAVVVAWQGVGIVTRQVTDDRPSSLASDEVRELASAQTATTVPVGPTSPSPTSPSTTAPVVAPTASPPPTTTPPRGTPTTAPAVASPTTTTTVRSSPPTSTPPPPAAETRTYNLVGGSAALRFAPEGVTVVWATPNSGFDVSVEPENVNGVKVEFESDSHRSRVDGWWSGGPQDRVREEDR